MSANQMNLQRRIADAMLAHAVAAAELEDRFGGAGGERSEWLASLDAALAEQLALLEVDAETMAGALALLALDLVARQPSLVRASS